MKIIILILILLILTAIIFKESISTGIFILFALFSIFLIPVILFRLVNSIKNSFSEIDNTKKFLYLFYLILFLLLSSGFFFFVYFLIFEIYLLIVCVGGECAQAGVSLVFTLPFALVSLVLVLIVQQIFWKLDLVPAWKSKTWFY